MRQNVNRALAGLLAVGLSLLLGAPALATDAADDTEADDLDVLVERLAETPIQVDDLMGNGETEAVTRRLTELAEDIDVPVYVALVARPISLVDSGRVDESLAGVLQQELGEGLYIVATPDSLVRPFGSGAGQEVQESLHRPVNAVKDRYRDGAADMSAAFEAALWLLAADDPGASMDDDIVADLESESWAERARSGFEREDAIGTRYVAAGVTGLAVLVAGATLTLLAWRRPLGARAVTVVDVPEGTFDAARQALNDAFDSAHERESERPEVTRRVLDRLDAAEVALSTGDDLDAVGALVLIGQAEAIADPNRSDDYRPCFVSPLHGAGDRQRAVSGMSLQVPVCRGCVEDLQPYLGARRRGRLLRYTEIDSVWARTGFGSLVGDLHEHVMDDRRGLR